ncbi:DUF7604 domain-containing protein [Bariatricus sp. HCP28S3_A7]|uniref:DUF7604 domain-containing protein n=1 Tax=Bariatricus sp. HCP28S3_A7 TaxID=3438894 RepID=UPI003F8C6EAC
MGRERGHTRSLPTRAAAILMALVMIGGIGLAHVNAADEENSNQSTVIENSVDTNEIEDAENRGLPGEEEQEELQQEENQQEENQQEELQREENQQEENQEEEIWQEENQQEENQLEELRQEGQQQEELQEEMQVFSKKATALTETAESAPLEVNLKSVDTETAPEHHKYIKYNGEDSYTLTLNVRGMYDSEKVKPKVDVLMVVDRSNSMFNNTMNYNNQRLSYMNILKQIITGTNGISEAVLNNTDLDARMAVVIYDGESDYSDWGLKNGAEKWDDATAVSSSWVWTTKKSEVDSSVNAIGKNSSSQGGGTNCQAGLYKGAEVLQSARSDAQKYVVFLSDGEPTFRYNSNGYTEGNGQNDNQNGHVGANAQAAYTQAAAMKGFAGFYTIGISSSSDSTFLTDLAEKPGAEEHAFFPAKEADDLAEAFKKIIASITEYTCRDVTITDTLSEYTELDGIFAPVIQVTNQDGNEVTTVKVGDEEISVSSLIDATYDAASKKVTVNFKEGYALNQDYTYSVSFRIKPTQLAYDTYADEGYNATGSDGSDAPGNTTSSGKAGFYSNAEGENAPTLTYTYGKTDSAASATVFYEEKPVVQVDSLTVLVTKNWANVSDDDEIPGQITVNLYQDDQTTPYKTLVLKAEEEWKGTFTSVAKGHTYTAEEEIVEGFESMVTGNQTNGFTIVNTKLPELTIGKEVTGAMGDKTRSYTMTIELRDKNGNPVSGTFSYTGEQKLGIEDAAQAPADGNLVFTNGTATIDLKHGQQITLKKLPHGGTFKVTEAADDAAGYEVTYNAVKGQTCAEGTLEEDGEVSVVNHKDKIPVTGIENYQIGRFLMISAAAGFLFVASVYLLFGRRRSRR